MDIVMSNMHGDIHVGEKVRFEVENQSDWRGALRGTLAHDGKEFVIDTDISGRLTIDKGYDVYFNTVQPV